MVQYYYERSTTMATSLYVEPAWGPSTTTTTAFEFRPRSYTFDRDRNEYNVSGTWLSSDIVEMGDKAYWTTPDNKELHVYTALSRNAASVNMAISTSSKKWATTTDAVYSKGTLVQPYIPAEEGTYPANGRHTDGYWYVKGAAVGPIPPDTVENLPYRTGPSGGRKLIKLEGGQLVTALIHGSSFFLYIKDSDNAAWRFLYDFAATTMNDVAIAPASQGIHVVFAYNGSNVRYHKVGLDGKSSLEKNLHTNQNAIDSVTITYDPAKQKVHAAWASKNATYNVAYNLYHIESLPGASDWYTPTQLTTENRAGYDHRSPSMALNSDKKPVIVSPQLYSNYLYCFYFDTAWRNTIAANIGSAYAQVEPSIVRAPNGTLHVAWFGLTPSYPTTNNILYTSSVNGGTSWGTAMHLTTNSGNIHTTSPSITVDKRNVVSVVYQKTIQVSPTVSNMLEMRRLVNGAWSSSISLKFDTTQNFTSSATLFDYDYELSFDTPPTVYMRALTPKSVGYLGEIIKNNNPTIALISPVNNQMLYENDTINISGDAYDADKDQSVTAYYQINNEARKVLATNLSQTQILLSKQLTFKGSKLYDGDTALTGTLAEGVAHTLKVWAEDSEKALSAIVERTFYVVPNRAPLLSVDAVVPSGVVDADKFKISGTATDQDANSTLKVTRRINAGNAVEIYSGSDRAWEFDLALSQLVVGQNTIVIEVIDNYGAKTSKTVTLNKKELKTPILQSVARYKIEPPKGSAKGVLLFIQRDEALDIKVELSMTASDEQEQYETLTPVNTAPVQQGLVEDTFEYEGLEAKQNIILKITPSRTDLALNHKIHLISGAVD